MKTVKYSSNELLASVASKTLEDKKSVFVGTGLPMIASMLAQRTFAPNLLIIFEAGGIGPIVPVLPISVGDSRTFHRAVCASSMHDVMSAGSAGHIDYGFLGAAMIDEYGNINTTIIGDWEKPKTRLPGSGGANDIGSFCLRTILIMRQDKQKFVKKIDFITTPGYLDGPGARERVGLPSIGGPYRVITQLGVYGFDDQTKKIKLLSLHPGVTVEQVLENSSMDIIIPDYVDHSPEPTEEEIRILHEIDPTGIVIK
jgi:glutaconate CoA-transferase, subunit B